LKEKILPVSPELQEILQSAGSSPLREPILAANLLKRPEICLNDLESVAQGANLAFFTEEDIAEQIELHIKYEGYIQKQIEQAEKYQKMENRIIHDQVNFQKMKGFI
jgi:tRNA uridine 5-carboxymethylaminomethyl modification enzyme